VCLCMCIRVLFVRHANRTFSAPYYAAIRVLSGSTILSNIISQNSGFFATLIEHKMCVLTFSTTLSESFLILRRIQPYIFM
jgi:hypothetical protein